MPTDTQPRPFLYMLGRMIVAAYLGIILTGPLPYGYLGFLRMSHGMLGDPLLAFFVLPGLRAFLMGLIAGPRLGAWAAVVGAIWFNLALVLDLLREGILPPPGGEGLLILVFEFLVFTGYPAFFGYLGGLASAACKLDERLCRFRYWAAAGGMVILLFGYSSVFGIGVAQSSADRFPSSVDGDKADVCLNGVFPAVHVSGESSGLSVVYNFDPTGTFVLLREETSNE